MHTFCPSEPSTRCSDPCWVTGVWDLASCPGGDCERARDQQVALRRCPGFCLGLPHSWGPSGLWAGRVTKPGQGGRKDGNSCVCLKQNRVPGPETQADTEQVTQGKGPHTQKHSQSRLQSGSWLHSPGPRAAPSPSSAPLTAPPGPHRLGGPRRGNMAAPGPGKRLSVFLETPPIGT